MGDFRAQQRVTIHDGTDDFGVLVTKPLFVRLSDGVDGSLIDSSGNLQVIQAANDGVDIGDVDVTSIFPGTVATNLGKAEDAVHTTGDVGVMGLAVRRDADTTLVSADGDYSPLQVNSDGALKVEVIESVVGQLKTDDSAFTIASDSVSASGYLADETAPDSVDEGDIGLARMTLDRKILTRVVGSTEADRLDINSSGQAQIDIAAVSVTAFPVSATTALNTELNPIFVQVVSTVTSGEEVHDFDTTVDVAKDGTDNHDYTVVGTTFLLKSIIASASGAMKLELQVGPVASLVTKAVFFTSGAKPTEQVDFNPPIEVPVTSTGTVRLIRRNDDNQAMDVYSTIVGNDI